ncbi:uncharacterized protein LOC132639339 [Lycium barbarum]|uniref:uncharacterized protein LOC132639339 n=1 Tax=Lycium barbarum TaxID=112863 RepID=UPI00293E4DA1|nr:uncharacterized protein LOC132639339 [Lycium barbarum]
MYHKIPGVLSQQVEQITGFKRDQFPLKYLGCPIFHARSKKVYYNDLIKKVKNKLQNWKGKLLSFGGKAVLINSVLQSIPIYMLSAVVPTKYTINDLHKIFARFYWSTKEEGKSRNWSSWDKMKPTEVQWKGGSQVWKRILEARDQVDQQIWWEPRNGACDVWEDNWTNLGSIKQEMPLEFQIDTSIKEEETVQHLFLIGEFAVEIWQYYNATVGIIVPRIQIHQTIVQWWYMQGPTKLNSVMQAAPAFICWLL